MGDQWDGGPVRWGTIGIGWNGWTNEKGDQWEGGPMSSNNVVGDLWIGAPMRRGPMRWGTNEMGDQWVGGTNEMGDQWNEWCMGANWGINEMGDQWDGGPMRWGTNEMGDQWDGGPMMCTRSKLLPMVTGSTRGKTIWIQLGAATVSPCQSESGRIGFKYDTLEKLRIIPWWCHYMGQVREMWLSCYLVLLSSDSKARQTSDPYAFHDTGPLWWKSRNPLVHCGFPSKRVNYAEFDVSFVVNLDKVLNTLSRLTTKTHLVSYQTLWWDLGSISNFMKTLFCSYLDFNKGIPTKIVAIS